ncbi:phage protease [Antrihabitans sp. NCIMB 15449]|uniref:Phage protease n=1 Tax=Antrihabitans spumae TaxID=3373370 RepID=A0ABW7JHZ6_9NOCA
MAETFVAEKLWKSLTEALGLPEDADAETVVAAVEDLVTTPDLDPAKAATVAAAAGLTMVDPHSLAALQRDAKRGRELTVAAARREVESDVEKALRRGAITPARRDHWVTLCAADPHMRTVLAGMPDEMAVPISETGHGQDGDGVVEKAQWFR